MSDTDDMPPIHPKWIHRVQAGISDIKRRNDEKVRPCTFLMLASGAEEYFKHVVTAIANELGVDVTDDEKMEPLYFLAAHGYKTGLKVAYRFHPDGAKREVDEYRQYEDVGMESLKRFLEADSDDDEKED